MFEQLKDRWQRFRARKPGHRFVETYNEGRRGKRSTAGHIGRLIAGVLLSVVGVVLMPAPGPGMLVVVLGLALLAHESLTVARILDAAELRVRPPVLALLAWWKRRSRGTHIVLILAGLILGAIAALAGLYLMTT